RQPRNAVDVHHVGRARQTQLHQRNEALPSGEDFRVLSERCEQRRGVIERCGGVIFERGWNHGAHPFRWNEPKGYPGGTSCVGGTLLGHRGRVKAGASALLLIRDLTATV